VDILRGLALLGIFVVNMLFFSGPAGYFSLTAYWPGPLNEAVEGFIRIFWQGAFYSIFSFLFGLGFALQLERASARGGSALPRYARRLAILLGIGLLHAILVWYGDILVAYAVGGFVLMLFAVQRTPVVALAAAFFFALSTLVYLGRLDLSLAGPAPWLTPGTFERVFGEGSYLDAVRLQGRMALREFGTLTSFLPTVLWLFLLGMMAGRWELFTRPRRWPWLAVLAVALPAALVFKGLYALWLLEGRYHPFARGFSFALGGPALAFVYMALLSLLLHNPLWQERLSLFGFAGRMALTNYLAQSVICTLLFNGYGLGLYTDLGPAVTFPLTLLIFAAQAFFSRFWLSRYRFGPAEWVWRSLTYGRPQPLRYEAAR